MLAAIGLAIFVTASHVSVGWRAAFVVILALVVAAFAFASWQLGRIGDGNDGGRRARVLSLTASASVALVASASLAYAITPSSGSRGLTIEIHEARKGSQTQGFVVTSKGHSKPGSRQTFAVIPILAPLLLEPEFTAEGTLELKISPSKRGPPGNEGKRGKPGKTGSEGKRGKEGKPGKHGRIGGRGRRGRRGERGPRGRRGPPGGLIGS